MTLLECNFFFLDVQLFVHTLFVHLNSSGDKRTAFEANSSGTVSTKRHPVTKLENMKKKGRPPGKKEKDMLWKEITEEEIRQAMSETAEEPVRIKMEDELPVDNCCTPAKKKIIRKKKEGSLDGEDIDFEDKPPKVRKKKIKTEISPGLISYTETGTQSEMQSSRTSCKCAGPQPSAQCSHSGNYKQLQHYNQLQQQPSCTYSGSKVNACSGANQERYIGHMDMKQGQQHSPKMKQGSYTNMKQVSNTKQNTQSCFQLCTQTGLKQEQKQNQVGLTSSQSGYKQNMQISLPPCTQCSLPSNTQCNLTSTSNVVYHQVLSVVYNQIHNVICHQAHNVTYQMGNVAY